MSGVPQFSQRAQNGGVNEHSAVVHDGFPWRDDRLRGPALAVLASSLVVLAFTVAILVWLGRPSVDASDGSIFVVELASSAPLIAAWLFTAIWLRLAYDLQREHDPTLPSLSRRWFFVAWILPIFMFYGPASSLTALDRSIYRRRPAHRRIYAWAVSFVLACPILAWTSRAGSHGYPFGLSQAQGTWLSVALVCVSWALWAWTVLTVSRSAIPAAAALNAEIARSGEIRV